MNQSVPLSTIIIINNNSNDGTEDFISELSNKQANVLAFNLEKNLGGAGGFSFGIKKFMTETNDEFIWIMDDDTIPSETALEKLLEAQKKLMEFSFLASNVRWTDKSPAKMNIPLVDQKNWINQVGFENLNYPRIRRATFVSIFVSKEMIYEAGLPIKEFFIWGDDSEYTERLFRRKPAYFVPNSIVVHKMKDNKDANIIYEKNKERLDRYFYAYRNRVYYSKFLEPQERAKTRLRILNEIKLVISKSKENKILKLSLILKGVFKGLTFNPSVEFIKKDEMRS